MLPFLTSQLGTVAQGHLKIGIIYILIRKDIHNFMKFSGLAFELLCSQGVYGGRASNII